MILITNLPKNYYPRATQRRQSKKNFNFLMLAVISPTVKIQSYQPTSVAVKFKQHFFNKI